MRIAFAVLMAVHGVAHLVGFAGAWRLAPDAMPYKTTVLGGHVNLGDAGMRAVGVLWLVLALAFAVAAGGAVVDRSWWPALAVGVTIASLFICATEWPEARIGVAINVLILGVLAVGRSMARI